MINLEILRDWEKDGFEGELQYRNETFEDLEYIERSDEFVVAAWISNFVYTECRGEFTSCKRNYGVF